MGQAVSFENRMGRKHTQVSKLGKAPRERQRKEGLYQKPRKRDFDETHNSGLEKQTKAEGNHY